MDLINYLYAEIYCMLNPPSVVIADPVIHRASSLASVTATAATSSGLPMPRKGCCIVIILRSSFSSPMMPAVNEESMKPGQIALTWIFCDAYSVAACRVILLTVPLEAQYAADHVRQVYPVPTQEG